MLTGEVLTVEVGRGDTIESRHRVHAAVVDRRGSVSAWGDRHRPTIPRSAIKTIQALPIVQTGAVTAFDITPEELALACASHSAEADHVSAVLAWLARLGLAEDDLECGPDTPIDDEATRLLFAGGGRPGPIHNCCSGKHAGFLTVARQLEVPTRGYIERGSPVQQLVTASIETFAGIDLAEVRAGRDGCGIPVFPIPLERLAFAMARLVDPVDLDDDVAASTVPVVAAAQLAYWVSGTGRTEMDLTAGAREPLVVKVGAEGVFMAALQGRGIGVALKAEDGAGRAADAAIRAILGHLGVLSAEASGPRPVTNKAGVEVGETVTIVPEPAEARLAP